MPDETPETPEAPKRDFGQLVRKGMGLVPFVPPPQDSSPLYGMTKALIDALVLNPRQYQMARNIYGAAQPKEISANTFRTNEGVVFRMNEKGQMLWAQMEPTAESLGEKEELDIKAFQSGDWVEFVDMGARKSIGEVFIGKGEGGEDVEPPKVFKIGGKEWTWDAEKKTFVEPPGVPHGVEKPEIPEISSKAILGRALAKIKGGAGEEELDELERLEYDAYLKELEPKPPTVALKDLADQARAKIIVNMKAGMDFEEAIKPLNPLEANAYARQMEESTGTIKAELIRKYLDGTLTDKERNVLFPQLMEAFFLMGFMGEGRGQPGYKDIPGFE